MTQNAALRENRVAGQILHKPDQMARPCVQKTGLLVRPNAQPGHILHFKTDDSLRRCGRSDGFRDRKDLSLVRTIGSFEGDHSFGRDDTKVNSERHYAAATIATHHPVAAIGIVEQHPECLRAAALQKHQAIRSEAGVPVAKMTDLFRGQGQAAFTIVGQQEIVTRTVVFIKSQKHSAVIL